MTNLTKDAAVEQVGIKVGELSYRLDGLDEAVLRKPLATGEWTLRDLLSHMLFWQHECLWALRSTLNGTYERRDYSDTDKVNAAGVEALKNVGPLEIVEQLRTSGLDIIEAIQMIPEELWEQKERLSAWVHGTIVAHYDEHFSDIDSVVGD